MATFGGLRRWAGDLLYPPRCAGCGAFGPLLCADCVAAIPRAAAPGHCLNCSAPWTGEHFCALCFGWKALDGAIAAFEHTAAARRAIHALKYDGVRGVAPLMAAEMAPLWNARFDSAYAVPLHRSRVRQRGYNQAEELLRVLGWPEGEGRLERQRKTARQVGLRETERRRNVAGAFRYTGPSLRGRTIALVDDVVTTGATAQECAAVLKDHGARAVSVIAFARAGWDAAAREEPILA